jgi:hypothetical protein
MVYQTTMLEFSQLKIYVFAAMNRVTVKQRTRLINNETVMNFQTALKNRNLGICV